jgi:hypothetical protein
MSKTRHVGAGVPLSRLPRFDQPTTALTPGVLNVLRVALDRADMSHRATGFKPYEIEAAKAWVISATRKAGASDQGATE